MKNAFQILERVRTAGIAPAQDNSRRERLPNLTSACIQWRGDPWLAFVYSEDLITPAVIKSRGEMMKRAAIYMRVSTSRQAEEGDSIPAQRDALRKYIDDHDNMVFAGEYLDDGISGTKADRDEYQRLLADIQSKKIDLVLCTKLDRLHRGLRNFLNMQDIMERNNCNWLAIWEPMYDSSTPQGKMIINTMVNLAQFEAENTGERIRQVFAHKKSQGEVTNGKIPYGYTVINKHLVPGPEADSARKIFDYFANTGRIGDTCRYAAGLGYTVDRAQLKSTLQNTRYIGRFAGNNAYCEPLIDQDLWRRVQSHIKAGTKNNTERVYIFSGLIVCAECGLKFSTCHVGSAVVYRCQGKYSRAVSVCENTRTIRETVLDRYLVENIANLITCESATVETEKKKVEDNSKKIASIERRLARLKDLYLDEQITMDEYKTDKAKYLEELDRLKSMQPEPQRDFDRIISLTGDDFAGRYWSWERTERRNFWRSVIDRISIDKDRRITVSFL